MRAFLCLALAVCLLSGPVAAQDNDLLSRVLAAYQKVTSIEVDVRAEVAVKLPAPSRHHTVLVLDRPKRLNWKSQITMRDHVLEYLVVADGHELCVYNSGESFTGSGESDVYYRRPYQGDVTELGDMLNLGLGSTVLQLMSGDRQAFIAGRELQQIEGEEPILVLTRRGPEGKTLVDRLFIDPKTMFVQRVESSEGEDVVAEAEIHYRLQGASFPNSKFHFMPPAGAHRGKLQAEPAVKEP